METGPKWPAQLLRWWRLGLLIIGTAVFAGLIVSVGARRSLEATISIGPGVLWVLLAPIVSYMLHATGWWMLIPPGLRPTLPRALRTYIAAQSLNELGGGLLGEPLKVAAVVDKHRAVGLSATVVDNLAQVAALSVFLIIGAIGFTATGVATELHGLLFAAALLVVGLSSAGALLVFGGRRKSEGKPRIRKYLNPPGWLSDRYNRLTHANRSFLQEHRQRLLASVAFHFAGKSWIIAEMALVLALLGQSDFSSVCWLGLGSSAASAAAVVVPGQIGAVEGTLMGVGIQIGMATDTIIVVALLRRFRWLVWIALGLLLAPRRT